MCITFKAGFWFMNIVKLYVRCLTIATVYWCIWYFFCCTCWSHPEARILVSILLFQTDSQLNIWNDSDQSVATNSSLALILATYLYVQTLNQPTMSFYANQIKMHASDNVLIHSSVRNRRSRASMAFLCQTVHSNLSKASARMYTRKTPSLGSSNIYKWTTWSECYHTKWAVDITEPPSSPSFWRNTRW